MDSGIVPIKNALRKSMIVSIDCTSNPRKVSDGIGGAKLVPVGEADAMLSARCSSVLSARALLLNRRRVSGGSRSPAPRIPAKALWCPDDRQ